MPRKSKHRHDWYADNPSTIKRGLVSPDCPDLIEDEEWHIGNGNFSDECQHADRDLTCAHPKFAAHFVGRPTCSYEICPFLRKKVT